MTCAIDQTEHDSLAALHSHLKKLKVTQESYYTQYAPVLDRHTGKPIPFKAPAADYIRREFASRTSLKGWLKDNPEIGREWALDWLQARVAEKGIKATPSHVELRSIPTPCPDVDYYDSTFEGGYAGVCAWLGLAPRFGGQLPGPRPLPSPIVIDTREQTPLKFSHPTVRGTLRSADYGLTAERDHGVYVERKSLSDWIGSLSSRETRPGDSNLNRIRRELGRVTEIGAYVVMVVEASLGECLAYNSIPYLRRQLSRVKVTPEHIFHNLRDLCQEFPDSFQPLFVANPTEAAAAVVRILSAGEVVKGVDLQLAYERGELDLEGSA